MKNVTLKPIDIVVVFVVFVFALFFIIPEKGTKKLVLTDGDKKTHLAWETQTLNLNDTMGKNIIIEIKKGRARVLSSDCPDKICVNTGWVQNCGQVAACLPNKMLLMVECGQ